METGMLMSIGKNVYKDKHNRAYFWGKVIVSGEETESSVMIPMANYLFVKVGNMITVKRLPSSKSYSQSYVMENICDFVQDISLIEMLVEHKVAEVLASKGI